MMKPVIAELLKEDKLNGYADSKALLKPDVF